MEQGGDPNHCKSRSSSKIPCVTSKDRLLLSCSSPSQLGWFLRLSLIVNVLKRKPKTHMVHIPAHCNTWRSAYQQPNRAVTYCISMRKCHQRFLDIVREGHASNQYQWKKGYQAVRHCGCFLTFNTTLRVRSVTLQHFIVILLAKSTSACWKVIEDGSMACSAAAGPKSTSASTQS